MADVFETASKRVIKQTAETTGDLNCNKITHKITKVSKNSKQNNLEIVINKKKTIDDLILI